MNQFGDIVGATAAIEHLQNALHRGEISHAYILSGEPGSGRMMLARTYAAALLCERPVEENGRMEPCGVCASCRKAAAMSHPDIQIYDETRLSAQDRSKNAVGIKLIRQMVADVQIRPYEGGRKVYIVPDADRMTVEAQNALLKTLEEPPAYAVLILLSNGTSTFLPTILSRCVTLRLYPLERQALTDDLVRQGLCEGERALIAAGISHGNPGLARRMASSTAYRELYESTMDLLYHLTERNAYDITAFSSRLASAAPIGNEEDGDRGRDASMPDEMGADLLIAPVDACLDLALFVVRDIMVCKSTHMTDGLILRDQIPYSSNIAQRVSYQTLLSLQNEILAAHRRRRAGSRDEQVLEVMLLKMRSLLR